MQERIDQYLSKEMSPEAIAAFEQELLTDQELKTALTLEIATRASTFAAGVSDQKAQFKARFDGPRVVQLQQRQRRRQIGLYLSSAAAMILLLLAVRFLVSPDPVSSQEMFAAYYEVPQAIVFRDAEGDSLRQAAHLAFSTKAFGQAAELFSTILQRPNLSQTDEIRFFLGVSEMEQNKISQAITTFLAISSSGDYGEMAEWYRALAYLKGDRPEQAKPLLQAIAQNERHHYARMAQEILAAL